MVFAFFYGTLIHPKILKRVIGQDVSHLRIRPALLLDYTRHNINGADYPCIVPYSESRVIFSGDLAPEERSVRGTLVAGLSERDMKLLDMFEGDEYRRELVQVYPLGPEVALDDTTGLTPPPPLPPLDELTGPVEVNTYVWCGSLSELQPRLWTFEEFVRESAWKWVGPASESNQYYDSEIDRRLCTA